ncbi:succinate--CoA ligase subunit alpha [Candidatus Nomurabacteria bacterium]|nr:succinate--CoA ligase subunit alpha [Candidatus Nomurabacteria bacterium]
MGIFVDKSSKIIVQGITGKEGQSATTAMLEYGSNVIGGTRPGKAGEFVEGKPVFHTVQDLVDRLGPVDVSAIYVPPFAAREAMMEAIEAGVKIINPIIERVPIKDTAYCLSAAKERGARIIGPSSLGFINPGQARVGVIGGPKDQADEIFMPGSIGIISRSGGMTNELSWQVRRAGMGQSSAVHVGGDLLMGTTYADILKEFEKDTQTKAVIIFGEHGGSYEFEIADLVRDKGFTKPLAVFVGGKFANSLPEGVNIGHAGAIVERGKGAAEKEAALKAAGVMIAQTYEHLVELVQPYA